MDNKQIKRTNLRRRLFWVLNVCLKYILKLNVSRNKKLWVYGAWEGNRYDDNSRYLFEYISDNHPDIQSVWLSPRQDIVDLVRAKGFRAEKSTSLRGIAAQLKAGVYFFTNGLEDIGNIALIQGATVIGLWHGTGMKNVFYMQAGKAKGKAEKLKDFKDRLFSVAYQDYTTATSEMVAEMRRATYRLKPEQILITGQPRNDVLKREFQPSAVLRNVKNADAYRYILYMPTYRLYENQVVEDFVEALSKDAAFVEYMKENKIIFLLKLHYLTRMDKSLVKFPFLILANDDVESTQELLAVSDMMITDYSGCCVDFALMNRPIVLYAPDYEEYCAKQGIKKEWYDIYSKMAVKTLPDAIRRIEVCFEQEQTDGLPKKINEMYEAPELHDTTYSENVYNAVIRVVERRSKS